MERRSSASSFAGVASGGLLQRPRPTALGWTEVLTRLSERPAHATAYDTRKAHSQMRNR